MAGTAPPPEDTDEARWAFQQRAQAEELSRPPVAGLERTEQLLAEYKDSAAFRNHVLDAIEHGYIGLRRCRRDGSCFYRGFGLAYLESLRRRAANDPTIWDQARSRNAQHRELVGVFYSAMVYEDLMDVFLEAFEAAQAPAADLLIEIFADPIRSDCIVSYLRFVTASEIQANAENYLPFLPAGYSPESFANTQVLVMSCEADQLELQALTSRFSVNLVVAYVDGRPGELVLHPFFQHDPPMADAVMLYRPGHYDLLYSAETMPEC